MENELSSPCPVMEPVKRYKERVNPDWARMVSEPPFPLLKTRNPRAQLGVRYERKVHWRLEGQYELHYVPSPWFMYHWRGRIRYCQPDALLVLPDRKVLLIIEVKYSHTSDSYWQLEHVYLPVLRAFLGPGNPWQLATVEVVKWFDPHTAFPCRIAMCEDLGLARTSVFNVHILNR